MLAVPKKEFKIEDLQTEKWHARIHDSHSDVGVALTRQLICVNIHHPTHPFPSPKYKFLTKTTFSKVKQGAWQIGNLFFFWGGGGGWQPEEWLIEGLQDHIPQKILILSFVKQIMVYTTCITS